MLVNALNAVGRASDGPAPLSDDGSDLHIAMQHQDHSASLCGTSAR